jgi:hypothetical protein
MYTFIVTGRMNGGEYRVMEIAATGRVNAVTVAKATGYSEIAKVIRKDIRHG